MCLTWLYENNGGGSFTRMIVRFFHQPSFAMLKAAHQA
jgi:hypothetical protein